MIYWCFGTGLPVLNLETPDRRSGWQQKSLEAYFSFRTEYPQCCPLCLRHPFYSYVLQAGSYTKSRLEIFVRFCWSQCHKLEYILSFLVKWDHFYSKLLLKLKRNHLSTCNGNLFTANVTQDWKNILFAKNICLPFRLFRGSSQAPQPVETSFLVTSSVESEAITF